MSGCPKGPGRDCGCESGLESESECDPCQSRCGEWQKTPNFVRSLPAPHVDANAQQMLQKGRIIFGSAVGSLLVGGWLYQKYLHYAAAKEAAKAKKTRAKPKPVNHEHMGIKGTSSTLVPKGKELANVESNKIVRTDIERPKEVNQELGLAGSDTTTSSKVKKELAKVADSKRVVIPKEDNHELQRKAGSATVMAPGVKKELTKVDAKSKVEPIKGLSSTLVPKVKELADAGSNKRVGTELVRPKEANEELQRKVVSDTGISSGVKRELTKVESKTKVETIGNQNKVKDDHARVKGSSSTLLSKVKELADVGSNKRVGTEIGKRKEGNEELKRKSGSDTGISSGVKGDLTKVESKKNIEPIGNPKRVKHDNLKFIVPSKTPRPEVKKETELEVACGVAQEGEKRKTEEGAVITVLTQGENGRKVKRRGWK